MQLEKLNLKQRNILSYIHLNANASYEEIARSCGTKVHSARYEVANLIRSKIVHPCMILNYTALGIQKYHVYFTVNNINSIQKSNLIKYLCSHSRISWVCEFLGEFDFGIAVMARDANDLSEVLDEIISDNHGIIAKRHISFCYDWYYFGKNYIFNHPKLSSRIQILKDNPVIKIDATDKAILKLITEDSLVSLQHMSKKIHLPISTISTRISALKSKKIISGYVYWLSYSKLRLTAYRVLINFGGLTKEMKKNILSFCQEHPNIVSLQYSVAAWDLELGIDLESHKNIHDIVDNFKSIVNKPVVKIIKLLRHDDIKWNISAPGIFD